ncbi:hypothetical protein ATCC90586_008885 [Pythium insidiosum]|nr:hypothetical protein ATCC90586_008885 [Pythium insidiosum]
MALALLWWMVSGVVCVLTTLTAYVYRRRRALGWSASSDDEDDDDDGDDDDEPEVEVTRTRKETAEGEKVALIDASAAIPVSTWGRNALLALLGRTPSPSPQPKLTKASRRHHRIAVPKVHKSHFYPVLDESLLWYARWEHSNRHLAAAPLESLSTDTQLDIRIEEPSAPLASLLSPPSLIAPI